MEGSVRVFHTNSWGGTRRGGAHWKGDLPIEEAHQYLTSLMDDLRSEGWNFESEESKILMLTHNILAGEQGYRELLDIYEYTDSVMKKEDDYFAFFVDVLEPASTAYTSGRIGEMFSILGDHQPHIRSGADKRRWVESLDVLTELQSSATVGDVIDHLAATHCPPLPGAIVLRESQLREYTQTSGEEMPRSLMETSRLRELPYSQVRSVASFINGNTPFSTKHGVKGLEFERVLVVVGRGWNHYNFNQMLEWVEGGVPAGKEDSFERSRNLFYVTCSRPKKHLVLLITEQLSESALRTLSRWFGADHVEGLDLEMAVTAAHSDL
jgi:DNA helicase-2/ATP-dependent DNA helicase PcrA